MAKLAIVATLDVAPGSMDRILPMLAAHRERCLRDEPGTLQFDVLKPREGENRILFYEVYADDAAFKAHWEGASVRQVQEEAKGLIVNLTGVRCDLQD